MNLPRMLTTLAVAVPLALAGCGDDSDSGGGGGEDGKALYSDAVTKLDNLKSGKLDANIDTILRANDQKLTVNEKATFAEGGGTKLPQFEIDIHVEDPKGQPQDTSAINDGKDFYVKQQGASEFESQGASALDAVTKTYDKEQTALGTGRIPLLSLTPSDWAKDPKVDGTEEIGGESLKKIVADLDVPKFLKDLETGKNSDVGMGVTLTQDARQLLEPDADVKTADLVALVDDKGYLRSLTAKVDGDVGGGVNVDFDLKMSGLDEPQEIAAP
jgi:hypothetical protein